MGFFYVSKRVKTKTRGKFRPKLFSKYLCVEKNDKTKQKRQQKPFEYRFSSSFKRQNSLHCWPLIEEVLLSTEGTHHNLAQPITGSPLRRHGLIH